MIRARNLTKRYGKTVALDDLSFELRPGVVTGFLGPNGAGKTTTMRIVLDLDRADSGEVTIGGRRYRDLPAPLREVGALLEARAIHGGRSAYNHLRWLAASNGIPTRRVDEVLGLVGLDVAARRRAASFSLGMGQRLGIAAALLGDPGVLIFDEPVNGLDPEGISWVRSLMRSLAQEGRTVFVSSHLMSEMALTADHVIVVGRGRLLRDEPMSSLIESSSAGVVRVVSPQAALLAETLGREGAEVASVAPSTLEVRGLQAARIGELAAATSVVLHQLTPVRASLEEAFMELTQDSVEFQARGQLGAA